MAALLMAAGASSVSQAALVLSVDFNNLNPGASPTETGFQSLNIPEGGIATAAQTYGAIGVTLDSRNMTNPGASAANTALGNVISRLRTIPGDSGGYTYSELYRDVALSGPPGVVTDRPALRLSLTGLLPNQAYSLVFYTFDVGAVPPSSPNSTATYYNITNNVVNSTTNFSWSPLTNPTSNTSHAVTIAATSNGSGQLVFAQIAQNTSGTFGNTAGNYGRAIMNGFQLSVVPEPSSLLLLMIGSVCVLRRRRR